MSEMDVDVERVEREHLQAVHEVAHWAYLAAVLIGGTATMLLLIAVLGGT
jgi:hypothetical protein